MTHRREPPSAAKSVQRVHVVVTCTLIPWDYLVASIAIFEWLCRGDSRHVLTCTSGLAPTLRSVASCLPISVTPATGRQAAHSVSYTVFPCESHEFDVQYSSATHKISVKFTFVVEAQLYLMNRRLLIACRLSRISVIDASCVHNVCCCAYRTSLSHDVVRPACPTPLVRASYRRATRLSTFP